MTRFQFRPRWKEELVVTANEGSFCFDLAMGMLIAFLPTEHDWPDKAPKWAHGLYPILREELGAWCGANNARLVIDHSGVVFDATPEQ